MKWSRIVELSPYVGVPLALLALRKQERQQEPRQDESYKNDGDHDQEADQEYDRQERIAWEKKMTKHDDEVEQVYKR